MKTGFDNEKYLKLQSEHIKQRIGEFEDKLYLEFGGKLFRRLSTPLGSPRLLPRTAGMLLQMADQAEIVIAISQRRGHREE